MTTWTPMPELDLTPIRAAASQARPTWWHHADPDHLSEDDWGTVHIDLVKYVTPAVVLAMCDEIEALRARVTDTTEPQPGDIHDTTDPAPAGTLLEDCDGELWQIDHDGLRHLSTSAPSGGSEIAEWAPYTIVRWGQAPTTTGRAHNIDPGWADASALTPPPARTGDRIADALDRIATAIEKAEAEAVA